jgi:hypothetical protein
MPYGKLPFVRLSILTEDRQKEKYEDADGRRAVGWVEVARPRLAARRRPWRVFALPQANNNIRLASKHIVSPIPYSRLTKPQSFQHDCKRNISSDYLLNL